MDNPDKKSTDAHPTTTPVNEAINHLQKAISGGTHWYIALLEAVRLWDKPEETAGRRSYRYLIDGEAFDWLLLAERLCQEISGVIPENERYALLFHGEPPLELTVDEFEKLIGTARYHQHLNYFYGITAEEALLQAVEDEVRKERRLSGYLREVDTASEAYRRIYGTTRAVLLRKFRKDNKYPHLKSTSLTEMKEFTYWLFKYRLRQSDKARVASDTKKALDWLEDKGFFSRRNKRDLRLEYAGITASEPLV